jgi:beta-lactamase regulating signal transducer with metallopeptidase domain
LQSAASSSAASESSLTAAPGSFKDRAGERFTLLLPWLVAAWFAGVILLSIRFVGGLIVAERLKRYEASPLLEQWQKKLSTLAKQLRVSVPVRLCESVLVQVPTVIGWMRPVILVPATALTGLSPEQLEALLAHELAHIRRYDYLVNLMQTAVETLLFYHPAVWWVSGQIRQEREHCCDDLAVAACGSVLVYARALAELEQLRSVAPQLAVAANGGSLLERIQRLVGSPARRPHRLESGLAGVIALATILSLLAGAQTTILSRITPIDDAQVARSLSTEAAPARAADKRTREQSLNQKSPAKSQDHTLQGEVDESKDAPSGEELNQGEEDEPSLDAEQDEKPTGSQEFARAIKELGYTSISDDEMDALKSQYVTPEYIREMNSLTNQKLPVNQLIAFRIHGVTPKFVTELRALDFTELSADQLTAFRIHGVTPQYISNWKSAGYTGLSADQLTAFRVHGVTPALAQQMRDLGFDRVSSDQLTALRIHGVTPNFIQAMRSLIRGDISVDELMGLRIHGVTPEFIKELEILGYASLSAGQLMGMRIHGVSPNFIMAVQSFGYKPTADQLTSMRIHGVTTDFIETVRSRGLDDVTINQLIEMRRLNIIAGARKK